MSSETEIAVKVTYNNISHESYVKKSMLREPKDLKTLISSIFPEIPVSYDTVVIKRKSKRSKKYVALNSLSDFKTLKRSLDVKSHLRLKIYDISKPSEVGPNGNVGDTCAVFNDKLDSIITKVDKLASDIKTQTLDLPSEPCKLTLFKHQGVFCDNCYPANIIGMRCIEGSRYKCTICSDFDLCEECFNNRAESGSHKSDHTMKMSDGYSETVINSNEASETIRVTQNIPQKVDHFIDIPITDVAYKNTMIDFVSKFTTAEKILSLIENNERYNKLMSLYHGAGVNGPNTSDAEFEALYLSVKTSMETDRKSKLVPENPELTCEINIHDNTLIVKLSNKSDGLTPKNMLLRFSCVSETNDLVKMNFNIDESLMSSNGVKLLKHNLYGLNLTDITETKYSVELLHNGKVYASGSCIDGSGFSFLNNADLRIDLQDGRNDTESSEIKSTTARSIESSTSMVDSRQTLRICDEVEEGIKSTLNACYTSEQIDNKTFDDSSCTEELSDFVDVTENIITEDDDEEEENDEEEYSSNFTDQDEYEVLSSADGYETN